MERLGFSVDGMLVDALKQRRVWDMAEAGDADQTSANVKRLQEAFQEDPEDALYAEDVTCSTPAMEKPADQDCEIKRILNGKIAEAIQLGLSPAHESELRRILGDHTDVFRLEFGQALPVDVEPLKVRLKEGAVPVKCALRRYPPAHMEYLKQHVEELEAAGLVNHNNRETWAAAPRIVAKKAPGEYRMTIDSRPMEVPMPWPMPNLDAAMATLVGMNVFFTLAVATVPILLDVTDAVAYCQSVVNQMFGELLYAGVLGWLDDLLGYADSSDKLFVLLDKVLSNCGKFRLKLHPKKCDFFLKKATWCGKVISAEGISHSPDRVQGLCALETSTSGADLQQFVCATNWMRSSIPSYSELIGPAEPVGRGGEGRSGKPTYGRTCSAGGKAAWKAAGEDVPNVTWSVSDGYYVTATGKIWIPEAAVDLQQRICIIAHQGAAGHRGVGVTTQGVLERFEWRTAKEDLNAFVGSCLHCLCVDGTMVPRPWGAALHAERPNELIHFDWLQLPPAANGWKYVLVVKDDKHKHMSGFCRLFPSATADAESTANALMIGLRHMAKEVVGKIKRMIGAHHQTTTPYTPWANGTVEVVNRLILRGLKTLTSEMKLRPDEGHRVLALVQSALNHQPADRLGGVAPVTAFQGFPSTTPLAGLVHPRTKKVLTVDWPSKARQKHMNVLRQAMENMHRDVAARREKLPQQARGRREKKAHVCLANFALGDFVLLGKIIKFPNKLALNWKGPYRLSRLVEPFGTSVHHASRLKFFSGAALNVTDDLVDYAAFGDEGYFVQELLGARRSADGQFEVRVKWKGLDEEEAPWEPALQLYEDIAVVLRRWIVKNASDGVVKEMRDDLEATLGHSL
ncbi:hypothetical protein H257_09473 [Aphanomyces astaci]|uniref:Chromo domain-containing protein n=1 Tax=Aphanomyces astaci TaxID=112090 RepID=W4GBK3_APHAT|nr:hypothetical protein H257_09473 [Aphanomyces astaci]ETV76454.1 hypothetical protein H257_09473 [Aphanomyces astaci]|eukprot:XP_009833999.1 hypothetical protein H257_09473 [Aphanomyces astaci]